ncbi:Endonuclease/exonuclease/phosphatase [Phycomyces blakesleeanus]|uniref:Endonuclease/exonuclease/phosphatase n=1 Tax=Phycomyces blakesleeanus TaxID=4837 RepID=A0ABR3B1P1_PHYBL
MASEKSLRFMTFNVRHDHGKESTLQAFAAPPEIAQEGGLDHEQPWSIRKWKIADTILLYSPDIVGIQEPVLHQVTDLESLLNDEYEWVGAGRNDGKEEGEYCAVFYKRESVTVESWALHWLSETPTVPGSKGWDASHPRIVTQVEFKRNDGSQFTLLNAHFDHKGIEARKGAADFLLKHTKDIQKVVVLLGDFNSPEDDPAYLSLTGAHYEGRKDQNSTLNHLEDLNQKLASAFSRRTGRPVRTTENNITLPTHHVFRRGMLKHLTEQGQQNLDQDQEPVFLDARYELVTRLTDERAVGSLSGPFGFAETFTSFGVGIDAENAPLRLDYIMILKNSSKVKVKTFAVLPNQYDDNLYISDHRPVLATLAW